MSVIALSLVLALTGCVGALDAEEFEAELQSRRADIPSSRALDGAAELASELGTPEVRFARITFDLPLVTYWVPVAEDAAPVESWRWDGAELTGPGSVPAEAAADLGGRTFTTDDVPALDRIDQLGAEAVVAAALDGGSPSGILVADRGDGVRIVVAVRADADRRHVVFTRDGDLVGVEDP